MLGFSGGASHLDMGEVLGDGVGLQQSGQGWQPQQTRSKPWRHDTSTQLWCQAVWYTLLCPSGALRDVTAVRRTHLEVGCPVGNGEGEVVDGNGEGEGEGEALGDGADPACLHTSSGIQ
jgi:hypothetical protein